MSAGVVVVGAGPAGLSAAAELRRLGAGPVLVADREPEPGGVPRHSWHTGYGLRDLRRVMTGPAYARALVSAALAAGAELRTGITVTGWTTGPDGTHAVTMTSPAGRETVAAAAVLLATGCRERPRTARLVPGDRPAGVMTTGELQQRVYLGGERLAGRALVVGAEHVSFSAALTLAHAGADVVALVTEHERQQSYAAFRFGAAVRWRVPVWTSSAVRRIAGRGRLEGVEVADVRTGAARFVPCEIVVFTGDWIPDHELARLAGLAMDPGTRGPVVDTTLATSLAGVFAAGNLVHAAETADIAALSGRHAARHIAASSGAAEGGPGRARGRPAAGRRRAGSGARGAAAAVDLAERDRIRRPSPAGPVRAAQRRLPPRGPAGGPAGRPAAGQVAPGPARSRNGRCISARAGWPRLTRRAARCASSPARSGGRRPTGSAGGLTTLCA